MYDVIEELVAVSAARGCSAAQAALAYLLGKPGVTSVIVGARDERQLEENLGAATFSLDDDERARLDRVSEPRLIYPYWHQKATASDRLSPGDRSLLARG